jgi:hypothetical protein
MLGVRVGVFFERHQDLLTTITIAKLDFVDQGLVIILFMSY